jgi:peptidyl-prolyl cis-trans isomerase SurA
LLEEGAMHKVVLSSLALALATSLAEPAPAEPITMERAVARVDGRWILLSEIRHRARPYLARLNGAVLRAAAARSTYRTLLEQRIDEELVAERAQTRGVGVSEPEVTETLVRIARDRGSDVPSLLAEALGVGYTETDYREEIRRQLLLQKLVTVEVPRRDAPASSDPKAYTAWFEAQQRRLLAKLRSDACVERLVRW